jgi:hypothetical protein
MKFIAGDSISKAVAYAGDAEETSSSLKQQQLTLK